MTNKLNSVKTFGLVIASIILFAFVGSRKGKTSTEVNREHVNFISRGHYTAIYSLEKMTEENLKFFDQQRAANLISQNTYDSLRLVYKSYNAYAQFLRQIRFDLIKRSEGFKNLEADTILIRYLNHLNEPSGLTSIELESIYSRSLKFDSAIFCLPFQLTRVDRYTRFVAHDFTNGKEEPQLWNRSIFKEQSLLEVLQAIEVLGINAAKYELDLTTMARKKMER